MMERKWGRVIMMGSFSAQSTLGKNIAYNTTKAAISNLTLGLAKTLKNTGITVNNVSPGIIVTENLEGYFIKIADQEGYQGPDRREQAIQWLLDNQVPQTVARLGTPEDIAYACAFLCSPQADFISAANIRIDGGASPSIN
jgi:NAD(P)-dependent dehydrogenase (short-subunit alcohol dehydrogenase family)